MAISGRRKISNNYSQRELENLRSRFADRLLHEDNANKRAEVIKEVREIDLHLLLRFGKPMLIHS